MSNRLYPTWEQLDALHNPLTPGEKALIHFLDSHLPTDPSWTPQKPLAHYNGWLIFAQPYFNGTRPDIVILHPSVGMVIYEVKDWDLSLYASHEGNFSVNTKHGYQRIKSPVKQVQHYRTKLISQLVPAIGEQIDREQRQERQPTFGRIKTGVYFHKSSTAVAQKLLAPKRKNPETQENYDKRIAEYFKFQMMVFGSDSLSSGDLRSIAPSAHWAGSPYWRPEWNTEIIFWLLPPYHSLEQGTPLTLRGNQSKVAEPKPGHHRVRGVAGSGKTQALAYRAGKLASQGHNVLIITYNITLWHYVHDMIKRAPFSFSMERFTLVHFHGFCKDRLNELGHEWPDSNEYQDVQKFFQTGVPNAVIQAINNAKLTGDVDLPTYDAILIDEGQDYHFEWYSLLSTYFLSQRDEVVVVCDKIQYIDQRELVCLDKRVTRMGLEKFQEDYVDLKASYRLPQSVAEITNEFSESFNLNQDLRAVKLTDKPTLLDQHHIIWLNIEQSQWREYIHFAYKRLKRAQYHPSDTVILLPTHERGFEAVAFFEGIRVDVNHVFERENEKGFHPNKKAFWPGDGRLKMSTIHSFKGWEAKNVVLLIEQTGESEEQLNAIVYTALTRTKENLIVFNTHPRYVEFGERLPKHWDKQ